ncbi:MAG TPA: hypothetical protein VFV00_08710 [Acidimicrobiales bacterium]|nr:hypothetical protein [Acidimicrobiales bacterium]
MNRRRVLATIATALLVSACGSSSPSARPTASSSAPGDGAGTTTIVVGADGSSTVLSGPDGGVVAPPDPASSALVPTPTVVREQLDGSGTPGSFAADLLVPARSTAIDVAIGAPQSAAPRPESIDHLTSVLGDVSGKTVAVVAGPAVTGDARDWTADELRTLAPSQTAPVGGHARITLLFVHGTLGGDNGVLGAAIRGDLAAIFVDRVNASATPLVGSSGIEAAVVTHEVGHLLGLVDLYLHTGRQDPEHPGHSTNKHSVMYWAVESDLVGDLLQGGPPREFDDADKADLARIRNGG